MGVKNRGGAEDAENRDNELNLLKIGSQRREEQQPQKARGTAEA